MLSVNDLPIANDDVVVVNSDSVDNPIYFSIDNNNGPDTFGGDGPSATDPFTFPIISINNGTVTLNTNGTPLDFSDDYIVYTPESGFYGDDSIEYTITDINGDQDSAVIYIEVYLDTDGDNVTDLVDLDDDNDGILDTIEGSETNRDTDEDEVPDYLDLDSDNDGTSDNFEAQATKLYIVPATSFVDLNQNGLCDIYESAQGGVDVVPVDTDGDEIPDYLDLDSDNDTFFDIEEADNASLDTDNDGKTNSIVGGNGLDDTLETSDGYDDLNGLIVTGDLTELIALYQDIDNDASIGDDAANQDINFRDKSIPDFIPTLFVDETVVDPNNSASIDLRVFIGEFASNSSLKNNELRLIVPFNPDFTIDFQPSSTMMNDEILNNPDWSVTETDVAFIFTYIGNDGIFAANGASILGLTLNFASVLNVSGTAPFKVSIQYYSGGEVINTNNDDFDYLNYFTP